MNSGKRIVLSSVAGLALGTFGCIAAVSAQAPAPGSPGQPAPRQDERTPAARAAENYDPLGVPVGSFRLFPELELDEVYNDNIYASSPAFGRVGSFVQVIKPTLDLRSDWNNHML